MAVAKSEKILLETRHSLSELEVKNALYVFNKVLTFSVYLILLTFSSLGFHDMGFSSSFLDCFF